MLNRTLIAALLLTAPLLAASCSSAVDNADHVACKDAWRARYNVTFATSISPSEVRWFQACMEEKGYKRYYDAGRCMRIEASIKEPRCYVKL